MPRGFWKRHLTEAIEILRQSTTVGEALEIMRQRWGVDVSTYALGNAMRRTHELGAPSDYLRGGCLANDQTAPFATPPPAPIEDRGDSCFVVADTVRPPVPDPAQSEAQLPKDVQRLVDLIRSGPRDFRAICDRLDLSPRRAESLLEQAEALGVQVAVAGQHVGLRWERESQEILDTGVPPTVGETQRFAVASDLHGGSKYCMRAQIVDFIDRAYDRGCTEVLIPGDFTTGCYRNQLFEQTAVALDDQIDDVGDFLPQKPGMTYRAITGNHDFTFAKEAGICVGSHIQQRFERFGRTDVKFYGDSARFLRVHGVVVYLFHPLGGKAYARSYKNQKMAEAFSSVKPQILLTGHYHMFDHCTPRGIQAICCPCFQGGQSAFGKSLPGAPDIGGLIPEFKLTEHGTIREFHLRHVQYFEHETIVEVRNSMPGIEVPPAVARPMAIPDTRWQSCDGGT